MPINREQLIQRLHTNTTNTEETCQLRRSLRLWIQYYRYNSRNNRACTRISHNYWSTVLDNTIKHLYIKLLLHRKIRIRTKNILNIIYNLDLN